MAMQRELLKHWNKKMATVPYPFEKVAPPEGLRGKHEYEQEKCIGCGLCARVCPSFAITLEGGPGPKMTGLTVDLGMCLFCQQCEEVCPRDCLRLTTDYELAVINKEDAILRFPREPPAPKVQPKVEKRELKGVFEVYKDKAGEYRFRLKGSNGQTVLSSEGYSAKAGCMNGIESVKENCLIPERFESYEDNAGKYRFRLKAANGQIIGVGEAYETEDSLTEGITSVKKWASNSIIKEE